MSHPHPSTRAVPARPVRRLRQRLALALAGAPLLLLAACFGGGDDGYGNSADAATTPATGQPAQVGDVPGSALSDAAAYTRFVAQRVASTDVSPLSLGDLTPPVSDTDDAAPVQ